MDRNIVVAVLLAAVLGVLALGSAFAGGEVEQTEPSRADRVVKSVDTWKAELTPEEFYVLREKGTERAFTGKFVEDHDRGIYTCAACGLELFHSDTKFESGTGWPSYYQPIAADRVDLHRDVTFGMVRTEVTCARCGGHLGHVFEDGPKPTGQRYCINGVSLDKVDAPADTKEKAKAKADAP